jgi:glyoxylase-like metal-dependent hydrolase (beta-lactamase superfamily II)
MQIESFFDTVTNTWTYLVIDEATRAAIVIDPVLDYDADTGKVIGDAAARFIQHCQKHRLQLLWILETHIHADHFTAAYHLQQRVGGQIAISAGIHDILEYWVPRLPNITGIPMQGQQFGCLLVDEEVIQVGNLSVTAMHTPGHTPADIAYLIEDAVFTGDTLFLPDVGTGRADFPGGGAEQAFQSIQRLYALPKTTRVFVGHDYPAQRAPQCESTIAAEKANNIMLNEKITEQEFIRKRVERDKILAAPKLLTSALHVNLRAGQLSQNEYDNILSGKSYPL